MLRLISIALSLILLAVPAVAVAQDSGIGAYEENVPDAGGDGDTSGTGTDTSTGTDVSGTDAATGTVVDTSGTLSEQTAAQAGTPTGQLPATGFDETVVLALIGTALIGAGFLLYRTSRRPA